jgi:hypothetical protein
MTNFDQRLREAGIAGEDIETQIQSADTALVLTARELILLEEQRVQRARLRDITAVKIVKTGELSVRSASESLIEGQVLGFEKTERKLFFDAVKEATARAKASVTNASLPGLTPVAPIISAPPPVNDRVTDTSDDLRALLTAPTDDSPPIFNDPLPSGFDTSRSSPAAEAEPSRVETLPSSEPQTITVRADPPDSTADAPREEDPWTANKQTFEVEPEKPASAHSNDPWVSATADPIPAATAAATSTPSAASGWDNPFEPSSNSNAAPAITSVQVSNDWSGDALNASTALGAGAAAGMVAGSAVEKSDLERKVTVMGADNTGTLLSVSRWLKILAVLFGLSSAAFVVTLAPADQGNVLGYLILIPIMFGSFLLALMAWGLGELLSAYAASNQDLRTIRRATLGH